MPEVSIIVPVRNGVHLIEQCLEAVFSQSLNNYEVIVVDGYSSDQTVEKASQFPIRLLYENHHTRAGACQVGVENAKGEYVAFTDADCRPQGDWLENLMREMGNGIVGVGGGIVQKGEGFWVRSVNLALSTFMGSANSIQGRFRKTRGFVGSISGSNSLYRKDDVMRVGGFNVKLKGGEDAELNHRISRIGKLVYTPDAIILHEHGRGLRGFASQLYHQYGRYTTQSNIWRLQVLVPLLLVPLLLLSLVFTKWFFLAMLGIYLVLIIVYGLRIAFQERDARYLFSIPIVYVTEHVTYSLAFWMGVVQRLRQREMKRC